MSTGFETRMMDAALQIDGTKPLFGLATRGITDATSITVGGLTAPVIAFAGGAWATDVTNAGGTYTWTIGGGGLYEYFVFDLAVGIPPANGFGMEIFNENGQLIYSSSVRAMSLIGEYVKQADENDYILASYPGKRLAVMQLNQPPVRQEHSFYGGAFGNGTYDEVVQEYQFVPYTARSDEPMNGTIMAGSYPSGYAYIPEVGRGDAPGGFVTYYGSWNYWIIDVTNL